MRRILRSVTFRRIATTSAYAAAGVVGGLATGILTARILLPGDRGALAIVITTVTLGALVGGLGTNVAFRVYFPRDPRVSLRKLARISSALSGLQVLVVLVALALFVSVGNIELSPLEIALAVFPLGISAFLVSQVLDALNGMGRADLSALTNTAGMWVTALALVPGLVFELGLSYVIVGYVLGFVARAIIGFRFIRRDPAWPVAETEPGGGRLLIGQGVKLLGLNLGQSVTFRADQYALAVLSTAQSVGYYAVAVAPASMAQIVSNTVGQTAMRDAATNSLSSGKLLKYTALTVGSTLVFAIGMIVIAPWAVPFVFGEDYRASVQIVQVLVIAEFALAPYLLLSKVAAGNGMIWLSSASGVLGLVLMIIVMPLIIPAYGALGAAWGCVVTYSVMSLFIGGGLWTSRGSKSGAVTPLVGA